MNDISHAALLLWLTGGFGSLLLLVLAWVINRTVTALDKVILILHGDGDTSPGIVARVSHTERDSAEIKAQLQSVHSKLDELQRTVVPRGLCERLHEQLGGQVESLIRAERFDHIGGPKGHGS